MFAEGIRCLDIQTQDDEIGKQFDENQYSDDSDLSEEEFYNWEYGENFFLIKICLMHFLDWPLQIRVFK